MQCEISGGNVKLFGRSVIALAKIGEFLFVDYKQESQTVRLRAVNTARSALFTFRFQTCFFDQFQCLDDYDDRNADDTVRVASSSRCKLVAKAVMMAFKSPATLDKTVESCHIQLCPEKECATIQLRCKYSLVKTFNLPYVDSDYLPTNLKQPALCNSFTAPAKLLSEAVLTFSNSQDEVSVAVDTHLFSMDNFMGASEHPNKAVQSQVKMHPSEFDSFRIAQKSSVTFCLQEFRAFAHFADAYLLPMSVSLDGAGRPIVFEAKNTQLFKAELYMSTLECSEAIEAPQGELTNASMAAASSHSLMLSRKRLQDTLRDEKDDGDSIEPEPTQPAAAAEYSLVHQSTPPAKRAKFFFNRCFNATINLQTVSGHVLAPDSDEEGQQQA